jgi:hypothetical protein
MNNRADGEQKRRQLIQLDTVLYVAIEHFAKKHQVSKSKYMRNAAIHWMNRHEL